MFISLFTGKTILNSNDRPNSSIKVTSKNLRKLKQKLHAYSEDTNCVRRSQITLTKFYVNNFL